MTEFTEFNKWFKKRREELGMSRAALAEALLISKKTAYEYEVKDRYPSRTTAQKIESVMGDIPESAMHKQNETVVTKYITRWKAIPSEWVEEERRLRGITQEGLSESTGISLNVIRGWDHGRAIKEHHLHLVLRHLSRRKVLPEFEDEQDSKEYMREIEQTRLFINALVGKQNKQAQV
jgi:ribosome-binding protein aMBF1 (putative translation factor)